MPRRGRDRKHCDEASAGDASLGAEGLGQHHHTGEDSYEESRGFHEDDHGGGGARRGLAGRPKNAAAQSATMTGGQGESTAPSTPWPAAEVKPSLAASDSP